MPRRRILSDRQRSALFYLPTDEAALLQHYTLADDDIANIRARRRPRNRLGFALQLCAFRYPGRLLTAGEIIPLEVSKFVAAQLGMRPNDLSGYAVQEETRRAHLTELRSIYERNGSQPWANWFAERLERWSNEGFDAFCYPRTGLTPNNIHVYAYTPPERGHEAFLQLDVDLYRHPPKIKDAKPLDCAPAYIRNLRYAINYRRLGAPVVDGGWLCYDKER